MEVKSLSNDRSLVYFLHLSLVLGYFVPLFSVGLPLAALYFSSSESIQNEAKKVLNVSLSILVYATLFFIFYRISQSSASQATSFLKSLSVFAGWTGMLVFGSLLTLGFFIQIVLSIKNLHLFYEGKRTSYPFCIPFFTRN